MHRMGRVKGIEVDSSRKFAYSKKAKFGDDPLICNPLCSNFVFETLRFLIFARENEWNIQIHRCYLESKS